MVASSLQCSVDRVAPEKLDILTSLPRSFNQDTITGDSIMDKLYPCKNQTPASPCHLMRRLLNGLDKTTNCWEWKRAINGKGYGTLTVDHKTERAHRLMFKLFYQVDIDGWCVLHKCDNPLCINPEHLFLGTLADNMQDAMRKGRLKVPTSSLFGEANPAAVLTQADVNVIRDHLRAGATQAQIAILFGVSESNISRIKRGETWKPAETQKETKDDTKL